MDPIGRIDPIDVIGRIDSISWIDRIDPKLHYAVWSFGSIGSIRPICQLDQLTDWIN